MEPGPLRGQEPGRKHAAAIVGKPPPAETGTERQTDVAKRHGDAPSTGMTHDRDGEGEESSTTARRRRG